MGQNKSYEDLKVWQKSLDLADAIYSATEKFPSREVYGLVQQLRRAAVSIPSNIAEGCARHSQKEFLQFLGIATGSLAETHTQLCLAVKRNYLTPECFALLKERIDEVRRMMNGLKASLNVPSPGKHRFPETLRNSELGTRN